MNTNGVRAAGFIGEKYRAKMILKAVSELYNIPVEKIVSKRRRQYLVDARSMVCYVMRQHTRLTYHEIGNLLGGRNHSTLISAFNSAHWNIDTYKSFRDDYTRVVERYKSMIKEDADD